MNTTKQRKSLGRFAPVAVMLAVLAVTAPATITFAGRVFADSILRQIALIVVTEFAFMLWHLTANGHARGERQHSVSQLMTWVSLAGVVIMAGVEIGIEFSGAGLIAKSPIFGTVGLVVLIGLMAAHLAAAVYYQHSDPDRLMREATERADAQIAEAVLEATANEAQAIAGEIAAQRARAFAERVRRQHAIAAQSERDSVSIVTPNAIAAGAASVFASEASDGMKVTTDPKATAARL